MQPLKWKITELCKIHLSHIHCFELATQSSCLILSAPHSLEKISPKIAHQGCDDRLQRHFVAGRRLCCALCCCWIHICATVKHTHTHIQTIFVTRENRICFLGWSLTDIKLKVRSLMPETQTPLLNHCPLPDTQLSYTQRKKLFKYEHTATQALLHFQNTFAIYLKFWVRRMI